MEPEALLQELRGDGARRPVAATPFNLEPWGLVFAEEWHRLLALGRRRFGMTKEDVEDAFQNCAASISQTAPLVRERRAYLTTAFLNACRDILKGRNVRARHEGEMRDRSHDPTREIDDAILARTGMASISPMCRELLHKWICEGALQAEVAAAHNVSRKKIHKRLARCLRTLADAIDDRQ